MKKKIKYPIFLLIILSIVSCDDYLGDNVNPNSAISATPELVLPNALTNTANLVRQYNSAGSWIVGYTVNAGGFGGWGATVSYNFVPTDHNTLWNNTFDDLNNYQFIIDATDGSTELAYFNAAAKVMKAMDYQMLVDFYGDVPYFEALKGADNLNPTYDPAPTVYKELVAELTAAINVFETAELATPLGTADVMMAGDVHRWSRFANTLKLRLLMRMSEVGSEAAFVTQEFANFNTTVGVITDDAIVNPGYLATDGKQNPMWATYHSNAAGSLAGSGRSAIPSIFVYSFYNGTKINDPARGARIYRDFPASTPRGQLGDLDSNPDALANQTSWYTGTGTGASASNSTGILKGRTAGQPIMLEAEAQFLLAEAYLKGFLSGDAQTAFEEGIAASFRYLYKDHTNAVTGTPEADAVAYIADNSGNRLVDFTAAATDEQRQEAIITQKYIALNFIHGHEAWNEFRRTSYPAITPGSSDPVATFASLLSNSTRADRLPVRVLYASTEYQLNAQNVPQDVNQFSDLIFWQPE